MKRLLIASLACLAPLYAQADELASWESLKFGADSPISIFALLTALSFLPFMMIALTTFTRNIVVLSFVRHALGLQTTPPNIVLIVLAAFLTLFVMAPTLERSYDAGAKPYLAGQLGPEEAAQGAWQPVRDFMIRQTHEDDLRLIYGLAKESLPASAEQVSPVKLIPAFMLSELKIAFQIGFMIFLPFLIIDLIVAAILMSLGMIMVPPITISLPLKVMLFLLIDGWGLVSQTLIRSVG
ncbi:MULTISPECIES: flagellar type III secretion system pore protein FliP [unclassified Pseudomonas]|uniref:flagellar type III secretion system pore protein FliP n=1 Tax=unclassified Pseudomonas TaxID=196821 RepID=UPI002447299F|nr:MULTISPECIES: flagellar type III secretion system pore protein FliP [unclassified Pseudomonas]MDG9930396.1 flagellar type III secretion system pore protein FliP [Pseudomonas sp. GD04042]MDH0484491.1 flagellar type III secretion system pore protein FliP [Pseudomonas sp. GD04015]MDH0606051.1 flagellar type III secretion system pore protein FliP [Pseudomonas sp. GD03869]